MEQVNCLNVFQNHPKNKNFYVKTKGKVPAINLNAQDGHSFLLPETPFDLKPTDKKMVLGYSTGTQ